MQEDSLLHNMRHSAEHVLAEAMYHLFPGVKMAMGPATDTGFYGDFDLPEGVSVSVDDLPKIEAEMKKIIDKRLPMIRKEVSSDEARKMFEGNEYKQDWINQIEQRGEVVSVYWTGDEFVDLCAGPHVNYLNEIKAFKLLSVAGAYWHGDSKNKMLTRIYGTAFPSKQELTDYLNMIEEAKKRDHRKLGKELGLFTVFDEGQGFPVFLPKGMILKNLLIDYWRELHTRENYMEISTPVILNRKLWETSGHWFHYKANMYTTIIDDEDYAIKPMNCPGGMLVYKSVPHSYKELPMRIGELGLVHRHEASGALHGLMRVRCFTQDDAHIYMTEEQIPDEIKGVVRLIDEVYKKFGFKYHVELSTRPEDSMGTEEEWETATNGLKKALDDLKIDYKINEGDGAFYGPKIDFHLEDCIGRTWQCGTIQLDFQLPQRFEAEYIGADGEKHRPIMIHRVIYGSLERFIGILTEEYAGKFPVWLAPVQVKVLPVSDKSLDYAKSVIDALKKAKIRCELDDKDEKIGYKIRQAQMEKVPFMLVLGEKEAEEGKISIRDRDGQQKNGFDLNEFIDAVKKVDEARSLKLWEE